MNVEIFREWKNSFAVFLVVEPLPCFVVSLDHLPLEVMQFCAKQKWFSNIAEQYDKIAILFVF